MIYFISSPKYQPMISKIISEEDEVCVGKEVGEDIYLKKLIKEQIAMFENIEILIVDFTALADTDQEIMQAVESLRLMDYRTRCIFLMPYRKEGDKFLRECFFAGIYDLITTDEYLEMSNELSYCIREGMKYKDALRYRDASEEEPMQQESMAVQKVIVGVSGTGRRMGSTHNSIVIANFLREQRQMVAVMEMNPTKVFNALCEQFRAKLFEEGYFTISGVDYYPSCDRERLTAVSGKLYNFIILDFGDYAAADKVLFNKCDVRIILSGTKPWELPGLEQIFREQDEDVLERYHFCFLGTTSRKLQKEIMEHMEPLKNIWFPMYSEDPFQCNTFLEGQIIFSDYLPTGSEIRKKEKSKRMGKLFEKVRISKGK